jgi:hypothetical protein
MKMNLIKRIFRNNINSKSIGIMICIILLCNGLFITAVSDNNQPQSSRANEIIGTLIGPGNYSDSVDSTFNPIDWYTIYLNGTIGNSDIITIIVHTSSNGFGVLQFINPDMFSIDYDFFNRFSGNVSLRRHAITSGYHYIGVAAAFGTVDYWLNVTIRKGTNPQNDGNNDFGNCTVAVDNDAYQEDLNYSRDYWDLFQITLPPNSNLTVTGEPSGALDIVMELYDAPNSSTEHMLYEADVGWGGEPEVLYFDTNVSTFTVYVRVYPFWDINEGSYWLNFSINSLNSAPEINLSDPNMNFWTDNPGIQINEDESSVGEINLSHHFIDDGQPLDAALIFTNISDNENITVTIHQNATVTFTPAANWSGSAVVTFNANDSVFNVSDEVNITVLPVNDPPVFETIPNQVWTQGIPVLIGLVITDIDSTEFTFDDNTTLFDIDQENRTINFTPTNNQVGVYFININVSDGTDNGSDQFKAEILNENDPPVIMKVGGKEPVPEGNVVFTVKEDEWFNFTMEVSDNDHKIGIMDEFSFSTNITDTAFNIDSQTGNVSFFPLQKHVEIPFFAEIRVEDGRGGNDTQSVEFKIKNTNDNPSVPVIKVDKIANLTANLSVDPVSDEDGDVILYYWDFGDNTPKENLGREVNHTYAKPGNYTITVTVDDDVGGMAESNITINIPGFAEDNKTNGKNDTNGDNKTDGKGFPDEDKDGLNDTWEIEQFGNITAYDADDDPDKDGFTNLQEYENNTDPEKSTDRPIDDKKDTDDDGITEATDTSDLEFFMNIIAIIAIVNLVLVILVMILMAVRRKPTQEPGLGRAPMPPSARGHEEFMVPCPECGASIPGDAVECPHCGEPIEAEEDYEDEAPAPGRPRSPRGRPEDDEYYDEPGGEEEWEGEEEEEYYDEDEGDEPEWEVRGRASGRRGIR